MPRAPFSRAFVVFRTPLLSRSCVAAMSLAAVAALTPFAASLRAQAVGGVGADATPIPRGGVRIRVAGDWSGAESVASDSGRTPWLSRLATPSLGTAQLPQLSAAQSAIRTLSANPAFSLTMGPLEARGDMRRSVTPISVEYGIASRLSIGLLIPYVESRDNALFVLNRAGAGANVGQNPAYSATLGSAARATNGALVRQLGAAMSALQSALTRCAVAGATGCDAIRQDPAGAQALLLRAQQARSAVSTVYGDSVRGGAPVVPLAGTATQTAVDAQLAALRKAFTDFGVSGLADSWVPASSRLINGPGAMDRIAADSAYGLSYTTLGGTRRAGIGDIDLTASYLLLNTVGDRPSAWLAARRLGVRSAIVAGWRFGTAGADRVEDALDVPIGGGANAVLLQSTTDVIVDRHWWLSGTLRMVQPLADQVAARRPLVMDSLLFAPTTASQATRTLGRQLHLELAPRYVLNQYLGLSLAYQYQAVAGTRFDFPMDATAPGATLRAPDQQQHRVAIGATYSTVTSYLQQRARWPLEVVFQHLETLAAHGAATPYLRGDRIELRILTGYLRD